MCIMANARLNVKDLSEADMKAIAPPMYHGEVDAS